MQKAAWEGQITDPEVRKDLDGIGWIKYDLQEEKIAHEFTYGYHQSAGEVLFQPRINATSEDDGYLMTFLYDGKEDKSYFVMWDAKTCEQAFKFQLAQRVPFGFHSAFVDEDDIQES